jgi:tellurite resistance protein
MNRQILIAALLALAGTAAIAQTNTPRVDQRQANQEQRIDNGIASGELTKRETKRLEKEQNVINRAENQAKADGTVSAAERRRLHKMQKHASHDIYRQKHDAQAPKP